MERIVSGFQLAEAPVVLPGGGVAFSDALGGGVYRWDADSGDVAVIVERRRGVGGMAAHADGGLVVSGRDLSHVSDEGMTRVLFADESVAGFNDLTVDRDGRVIVAILRFHPFAGEAPVPGEFSRIDGSGAVSPVLAGVDWGNGCAFSPDGATFYGCDFQHGVVLAASCHDDGTYGHPRVVVRSPSGQADGLAVDESGALWVALGQGAAVGRFRPDGGLDLRLEADAFVSSVCFGPSEELFVTTAGTPEHPQAGGLYRARVATHGVPIPLARL